MSKMQEHIFDDVHGRTVCRKCRVMAVFRNANSLAFRRYHAFACSDGRRIFSTMPAPWQKKSKSETKFIWYLQCFGCANNATLLSLQQNKGDKDAT
jgi:hypothetical protein